MVCNHFYSSVVDSLSWSLIFPPKFSPHHDSSELLYNNHLVLFYQGKVRGVLRESLASAFVTTFSIPLCLLSRKKRGYYPLERVCLYLHAQKAEVKRKCFFKKISNYQYKVENRCFLNLKEMCFSSPTMDSLLLCWNYGSFLMYVRKMQLRC